MSRIPWIGLAALISMFVLPYVPDWLFEGPRTIKHRPRRHVCRDCGEPWSAGHTCPSVAGIPRPLRGELRRLHTSGDPDHAAAQGGRPGREVMRRIPQVIADRAVSPRRSRLLGQGRFRRPNRPYRLD
jgi:hypothetical protein